jgi:hypothetical protein
MTQNYLLTAGTPIIEKLVLTTCLGQTLDITPQLVSFAINEDMYFPCLTGTIHISDGIGMFDQLPIAGNEKLTIKFYSWDYADNNRTCDFIFRTFDVLKVTDIKQVNDYTKNYTLHFASPELKLNETIKISQSYQNVSISQVIANILTENYDKTNTEPRGLNLPKTDLAQLVVKSSFLNPAGDKSDNVELLAQKIDDFDTIEIFVEKTKYIEPFITIPYSKPFDMINQLASRSIRLCGGRNNTSEANTVCNFVFFENKRGYQFISIETLLEDGTGDNTTFYFGNAAQNYSPKSGQRTVTRQVIEKLYFVDCHDILNNINDGMYASRFLTYDMSTGEMYTNDYDYNVEFPHTESTERTGSVNGIVNDYPMIFTDKQNSKSDLTNKPLSRYMMMPTTIKGIDLMTAGHSQRIDDKKLLVGTQEFLQRRASQLARLNTLKVIIEIAGNSKHKVGDLVTLDLNYLPVSDGNSVPHETRLKYYSGNYLIVGIRHTVSMMEYKMTLELAKDSFLQKIGQLSNSTDIVDTTL